MVAGHASTRLWGRHHLGTRNLFLNQLYSRAANRYLGSTGHCGSSDSHRLGRLRCHLPGSAPHAAHAQNTWPQHHSSEEDELAGPGEDHPPAPPLTVQTLCLHFMSGLLGLF